MDEREEARGIAGRWDVDELSSSGAIDSLVKLVGSVCDERDSLKDAAAKAVKGMHARGCKCAKFHPSGYPPDEVDPRCLAARAKAKG